MTRIVKRWERSIGKMETPFLFDRIAEIKRLEAEAPALLAPWEDNRWRAAELYAQENAAGKSLRDLADEISTGQVSVSKTHVGYMVKVWQIFGNLSCQRPSWNEAYNSKEVRGPAYAEEEPDNPDYQEPGTLGRVKVHLKALRDADTVLARCQSVRAVNELKGAGNKKAYQTQKGALWHHRATSDSRGGSSTGAICSLRE